MSKKIRVHKKHGNRLARDRRLSNIFTRNLGVTLLPGDKSEIVNMATLKKVTKKSNQQVFDLTGHQHKWTVLLCVFGRSINGDEYFKTEEVESARVCYSKDISESMNDRTREIYDQFNNSDFCSLGWIACPHEREFNLIDMAELFTTLGAWDYLSNREIAEK